MNRDEAKLLCKHLVPPKESILRWHCDMGDGRSGDCQIFLGKSKKCKYQTGKTNNSNWQGEKMSEEIKVSEAAYQRALEKKQDMLKLIECLRYNVCPCCAADMEIICDGKRRFHLCEQCDYENTIEEL